MVWVRTRMFCSVPVWLFIDFQHATTTLVSSWQSGGDYKFVTEIPECWRGRSESTAIWCNAEKVISFQYEKFPHPAMKNRWESWDGKINFNDLNASIPQLSSQVPVFSSMSFRVLDFWVHYKKLLFFCCVCCFFYVNFLLYLKENQSGGIICERARERKNKLYLQKMVSKFTGWRKVGVGMWREEEKKRSSNAKWTSLINRNEAFFIHWRN